MTTEELENYKPKRIGFPKEIIARMLECQEEQYNKIDVSVFEKDRTYIFLKTETSILLYCSSWHSSMRE